MAFFKKILGTNRKSIDLNSLGLYNKDINNKLKLVFLGGHECGKSCIAKVLNKEKFSNEYNPTIGIDQYKIRLENSENKEILWIWDVSHAELGGFHESLIFHECHGIILVCDLTSFKCIQSVDSWLNCIQSHIKMMIEKYHQNIKDCNDNINYNNNNKKSSNININNNESDTKINDEKESLNDNVLYIPRIYLLITKYDLSDEPILTDTQLHKFCKSNNIRAFARISVKIDKRSDILDIFNTFTQDIIKHLPKNGDVFGSQYVKYKLNDNKKQRSRYEYALERMRRNKIKMTNNKSKKNINKIDDTIFDITNYQIKTFKWGNNNINYKYNNIKMNSNDNDNNNNNNNNDDDNELTNNNNKIINADILLKNCENKAKNVLINMKQAIKLQINKLDYMDNNNNNNDITIYLKYEMLNGLNQEINHLTKYWEDELNTIAELIRFQLPLIIISQDIHILSQSIQAREMIFKKRIQFITSLKPSKNSNKNNNNNNNINNNNKSDNTSNDIPNSIVVQELP